MNRFKRFRPLLYRLYQNWGVIAIAKPTKTREYNQARAEANRRYDAKTYKKINIALRVQEDADIVRSHEEAQSKGLTNREWLRELFEGRK